MLSKNCLTLSRVSLTKFIPILICPPHGHIRKVAHISHCAAQLDAIFQALQWMLKEYKCIEDEHDIKANSLELFKLLSSISGNKYCGYQ